MIRSITNFFSCCGGDRKFHDDSDNELENDEARQKKKEIDNLMKKKMAYYTAENEKEYDFVNNHYEVAKAIKSDNEQHGKETELLSTNREEEYKIAEKVKDKQIDHDQNLNSDLDKLLFTNENLITQKEKEIGLVFTKRGIIKFIEELDNLEEFEKLYEKDYLALHCRRKGSQFSTDFYLGKSSYKIDKKKLYGGKPETITIEQIKEVV